MMNRLTPDHLLHHSIAVNSDIFPINRDWINSLGLKLKVIEPLSGQEWFKIRYSGLRYNDGLLGPDGKIPLIVQAISEEGREILIFDERKHGYESLLVEKKDFDTPVFQSYVDDSSSLLYRIYVCTNSSIDFEDEFTGNENGLILTLEDKFRSMEWLQANAFDYIVVFLESEQGNFIKLMELELA